MAQIRSKTKRDITGYQNWEKVTLPTGQVYYKDPTQPGIVYDPVMSGVLGSSVFRPDPTYEINKQQEAEAAAKKQQDLQNQALSPQGQLLPIAGPVAGTVGAAYLINSLGTTGATAGTVAGTGVGAGAGAGIGAGSGAATGTAAGAGTALSTAPAAGTTGALGFLPTLGLGAGVAAGGYLGVRGIQDALAQEETKTPMDWASRVQAGILTGGFSEIGRALGIGHKSVKSRQDENWGKLAKQGVVGAAEQKAALDNLGDKAGKDLITGEKWNFDKALARVKAGAHDEFAGTLGMFKAFGNDNANYTPEQKRAIVAANAAEDNWISKDGDVLFKDEKKAREIKDKILAGTTEPQGFVNTVTAQRSQTSSPGIGKDGKPMLYWKR